jgi:hypothetical protein
MHVKTSGSIAGGAFILSFLIGLIGGAGFPLILVRALVFALFGFALSEGIHLVVKQFLIEPPNVTDGDAPPAGSHVDISVEDASGVEPSSTVIKDQAPTGGAEFAKPTTTASRADDAASAGGLSNEDALFGAAPASGALDVEAKNVLAETADADGANSAAAASPAANGAMETLFSNVPMPLKDVKLPDMENMTDAFVEKKEEELFEPPPRKQTRKAAEALGKNYDPAKVANAIKTLLRK